MIKELRFKARKTKGYKTYASKVEALISCTLSRPQSKLHKKWAKRTREEKLEGGCG